MNPNPNPRKESVKMESREPWSIRFTPSERAAITAAATAKGVEPSRFARILALTGLRMHQAQAYVEEHTRATA